MRDIVRQCITAVMRGALGILGQRTHQKLSRVIGQALLPAAMPESYVDVSTRGGPLRFYCAGELARWRAETLFTKEPDTIRWLDNIEHNEVLWDIGANMGVYTLYAVQACKARVLSFEPSAPNFFLINRNLEVNNFSDRATAYCLAFSDKNCIDTLRMQDTRLGGALNSFGIAIGEHGNTYDAHFLQGTIGYTIDRFIGTYAPPFPNHIKIDVDGIEDLIVAGATTTLSDSRLKSVSIEVDQTRKEYASAIIAVMKEHGLLQTDMFKGNHKQKGVDNYHFLRISE